MDITGDNIPEFLISLGDGGAYIDCLTLIRMENGEPVLALFKQKNGTISPYCFYEGASVMDGLTSKMIPSNNIIYMASWDWDEPNSSFHVTMEAYQWKEKTKTFDYDKDLSEEILLEYFSPFKY